MPVYPLDFACEFYAFGECIELHYQMPDGSVIDTGLHMSAADIDVKAMLRWLESELIAGIACRRMRRAREEVQP
jgi:hypothetical protein